MMLAYLLAASPQIDLRNGARALELAERVYNTTGAVQHGALVVLALAEQGRCSEASDWQRRMIEAAEQQHNTDLLAKIKALNFNANTQSCRVTGEAFADVLLFEKN